MRREATGPRLSVLLYHHIGPVREEACRGLTVEPEVFSRHMAALSAMGFASVGPSQWVDHVRSGSAIPRYPLMLTFDDAYADLTTYAFPVLSKHGFTATVFVPTSFTGTSLRCSPQRADASLPIMSAGAIRESAALGIEFGAHSRTHADLTGLAAADVLEEMRGSRDELASLTGSAVTAFAYPYGRHDATCKRIAEELFAAAFTIEEGLNDRDTPLATLRRTMVQHRDTVVDVCLRARFGSSVLQRVRTAAGRGPRGAAPAKA